MERVYWRMIDYRLWFLRSIFSLPLIFFETSTRIIILCFQTREISSYLHFLSNEMFEYAIQRDTYMDNVNKGLSYLEHAQKGDPLAPSHAELRRSGCHVSVFKRVSRRRNLLDEERRGGPNRGWRSGRGHWRRVWTMAEDRSAPRIEFPFVRSFRITVINGGTDSWNPCQIPISAAGRNISGIVIQDHRRRQGHVISTIQSTGNSPRGGRAPPK